MSLKREADPFIKPDPDAKRVKTEGGDGYFSLASIPMAPRPATFASSTSSAIAPKTEGGDRKPLGPVSGFHNAVLRYLLLEPPQRANRPPSFVSLYIGCPIHFPRTSRTHQNAIEPSF